MRALGKQGGVYSCFLGFSFSPLVRTDSRGPLWSGSGGVRQGSVVIHLFISLFITFAANVFTIVLFCGLFAKCIVSQVCFKLALSWKVAQGASESGGKGWRAIAKHYIICISVNVPFFVLRIHKADEEMETVGDTQAPCIAT